MATRSEVSKAYIYFAEGESQCCDFGLTDLAASHLPTLSLNDQIRRPESSHSLGEKLQVKFSPLVSCKLSVDSL